MKLTDIPAKQAVPFGVNGQREALLPTTPAGDNKASYNNGFPPVTMLLKAAGGLPPKGQDMNQILFELSSLCRWFSAGGAIPFDQSFCTSISGYPKGSRIIGNDGSTVYISTIDSNTNDPNTSSTGWLNLAKLSSIAGLSGGANKLPYFTGNDTAGQTDLTQVGIDIIGKESIDAVFQYLQLGEAAKLAVASDQDMKAGIATNLLPTVHAVMSLFSKRNFSGNNYIRIPDVDGGLIIQWGVTKGSISQTDYRNYPIPFPVESVFVSVVYSGIDHYGLGCSSERVDGARFLPYVRDSQGFISPDSILFFAMGY